MTPKISIATYCTNQGLLTASDILSLLMSHSGLRPDVWIPKYLSSVWIDLVLCPYLKACRFIIGNASPYEQKNFASTGKPGRAMVSITYADI